MAEFIVYELDCGPLGAYAQLVFLARRHAMSRCTLRNIFTVLIYAGVAIFLYPYLTGRLSSGISSWLPALALPSYADSALRLHRR